MSEIANPAPGDDISSTASADRDVTDNDETPSTEIAQIPSVGRRVRPMAGPAGFSVQTALSRAIADAAQPISILPELQRNLSMLPAVKGLLGVDSASIAVKALIKDAAVASPLQNLSSSAAFLSGVGAGSARLPGVAGDVGRYHAFRAAQPGLLAESLALRDSTAVIKNLSISAPVQGELARVAGGFGALGVQQLVGQLQAPAGQAIGLLNAASLFQRTKVLPVPELAPPAWLTSASSAFWPLGTQLQEMLRRNSELLLDSFVRSFEFATRVTAAAYAALLDARNAAVRGDREAVADFMNWWLETPKAGEEDRVLAVSDALLALDPSELDQDKAWTLLGRVEKDHDKRFRGWRPLGDTQLKGKLVTSLDALPGVVGSQDGADGICPTFASAEAVAFGVLGAITDPRLIMIFSTLDRAELPVALMKSQGPQVSTIT